MNRNAAALAPRKLQRLVRRRAHQLTLLAYRQLLEKLRADLDQGIVTEDRIESWHPALVRLDNGAQDEGEIRFLTQQGGR